MTLAGAKDVERSAFLSSLFGCAVTAYRDGSIVLDENLLFTPAQVERLEKMIAVYQGETE